MADSPLPIIMEVLERDLAIFGFFIALERSTQSFLFANGFESMDEPVEGLIRCNFQEMRSVLFLSTSHFSPYITIFFKQVPNWRKRAILSSAVSN
ncbi:UNVERIFIED_CONTAM: hypothetical protein Sradi_3398700 [Sesamum radiatum]|uniref:Uncharacterized protein n=1 Tax=Sesamum radiatum TaxID=300843 RepID=A0AAW2R461_SESRA